MMSNNIAAKRGIKAAGAGTMCRGMDERAVCLERAVCARYLALFIHEREHGAVPRTVQVMRLPRIDGKACHYMQDVRNEDVRNA